MPKSTNPARDELIATKLQSIAQQVEELIHRETGEKLGVILLIQPWANGADASPRAMPYVSNFPRQHVAEALEALLERWHDGGVFHRT